MGLKGTHKSPGSALDNDASIQALDQSWTSICERSYGQTQVLLNDQMNDHFVHQMDQIESSRDGQTEKPPQPNPALMGRQTGQPSAVAAGPRISCTLVVLNHRRFLNPHSIVPTHHLNCFTSNRHRSVY